MARLASLLSTSIAKQIILKSGRASDKHPTHLEKDFLQIYPLLADQVKFKLAKMQAHDKSVT